MYKVYLDPGGGTHRIKYHILSATGDEPPERAWVQRRGDDAEALVRAAVRERLSGASPGGGEAAAPELFGAAAFGEGMECGDCSGEVPAPPELAGPPPPPPEQPRPKRLCGRPKFMADNPSFCGFSASDRQRLGSRHKQEYEFTRAEEQEQLAQERLKVEQLLQLREDMVGELRHLTAQAEALATREGLEPGEVDLARYLQQALIELIDDEELPAQEEAAAEAAAEEAVAADEVPAAAEARELAADIEAASEARVAAMADAATSAAAAAEAASEAALDAALGEGAAADPGLQRDAAAAEAASSKAAVALAAAEAGLRDASAATRRADGALAEARAAEAAAAAAAASDSESEGAADADAAPTPRRHARHGIGAALRPLLRRVSELEKAGKYAKAAELLATAPSGTSLGRKALHMRAHQLRDTAFSIGGLDATKAAVALFIKQLEVQQLLPEQLRDRQHDAADDEVGRMMLDTAKAFFTQVFGPRPKGGRRDAETANALRAAAVALLPRDIFEKRHGRAAQRLLGVSYRLAKAASAERGELEDRACGWRRVTEVHTDAVDYAPLQEFWHSDAASTEDNWHKEEVRVFRGIDEQTGEIMCAGPTVPY